MYQRRMIRTSLNLKRCKFEGVARMHFAPLGEKLITFYECKRDISEYCEHRKVGALNDRRVNFCRWQPEHEERR